MLEIKNLNCYYGKLHVIRDLNMKIDNESVGLFGPNGAGKTTLINAVLGIVKNVSGELIFDGENILHRDTHLAARGGIALVPQERELFPALSVYENLELGSAFIPHAKDKTSKMVKRVYEIFPILEERKSQLAGTMSGGQQRQLAIGRALMSIPKLLILDEPSLGLQPSIVSELFSILKDMKNETSILVTEQNVRESLRAVDRGYVLENGKIVMDKSSADLADDPHVLKAYLGI